jgi:hypothetical protein
VTGRHKTRGSTRKETGSNERETKITTELLVGKQN